LPGSCALRICGFSQLAVTWLLFPPNNEQGASWMRSGSGFAVGSFFFNFFRRFHCRRLYWFVLETIIINSDASAAKGIYSPPDHGYLK
jgi:hypothetical protein